MNDYCGVINIYKEKGYTSHDVVNIVRKALGRVKTGHTGTLDPEAEGVLPVCLGKATKIADYISSDVKTYKAQLILGSNTDTQDSTGNVIEVFDLKPNTSTIEQAVNSFIGEYFQMPPMYSAIKVGGQALYRLAREGIEVERKARHVVIHNIKTLYIENNIVEFEVTCSKGTYIRALCFDIGKKLNCGGHMGSLLRIKAGGFTIDNAIKLAELKRRAEEGDVDEIIMPMEKALEGYRVFYAHKDSEKYLYNGNKLSFEHVIDFDSEIGNNEKFIIMDCMGQLMGVYLLDNQVIRPVTFLYKGICQ